MSASRAHTEPRLLVSAWVLLLMTASWRVDSASMTAALETVPSVRHLHGIVTCALNKDRLYRLLRLSCCIAPLWWFNTMVSLKYAVLAHAPCLTPPLLSCCTCVARCAPAGTYNDAVRNDTSSPCTACPIGTTTVRDGADSVDDCTACAPGYRGPNCATPCGGAVASYGPAGRSLGAECTACSVAKVGYSYNWNGGMDTFAPASVARLGAASGYDCLAEFVQVRAGS